MFKEGVPLFWKYKFVLELLYTIVSQKLLVLSFNLKRLLTDFEVTFLLMQNKTENGKFACSDRL